MATRNRGYEGLLDEYAAYTPYKTFEAEAGMRRGADIQAVKAGLTQKLRRAEPEGATSSYYVPGQRGSALMNYGALANQFGARRAALAGAEGRIAGNVEAREQMYKSKYIYENLLDNLAAEEATAAAEHEYHQGIMKGVTAATATGVGAAAALTKIVKKYDAMQLTPEAKVESMDEQIDLATLEDERLAGLRAEEQERTDRFMADLEKTTEEEEALFPEPKPVSQADAQTARNRGLFPQVGQHAEVVIEAERAIEEAQAEVDRNPLRPMAYEMSGKFDLGRAQALAAIRKLDEAKERYKKLMQGLRAAYPQYESLLASERASYTKGPDLSSIDMPVSVAGE